jgi:LemA protein
MLYIPIALLFLLFFGGVYYHNLLVTKKNRMKEAWSGIDVYLKKRYELVPNLIEVVKAYTLHEQQLMEKLASLRAAAINSQQGTAKIGAENNFSAQLSQVLLIAENYPDLKASSNFQQLQTQLQTLETEIELSRRYYNGTVRDNNIAVQTFPGNLIACLFKFEDGIFFEIVNQTERESPNLSFHS